MGNYIDLTNQRFGKLLVIKKGNGRKTQGGQYKITWICKCDCGTITEVDGEKLRKGHTTSCGCQKKSNKGSRFEDLTGKKFNRLLVLRMLSQDERKARGYIWLCKCDCGKLVHANANKLKNGLQQSCGCLKEEMKYDIGNVNRKYTYSNKRLYGIYRSMMNRCYNPNAREYSNYGGRGISVCPDWLGEMGYDSFAEWALGSGYDISAKPGECTLDRTDVNKGYSPDNCRWITNKQQQNNKRNCHRIEYNGEVHTIAEWAELIGIPYDRLYGGVIQRNRPISDFINK